MSANIIRIALLLMLASGSCCKIRKEQWCITNTRKNKDIVCITVPTCPKRTVTAAAP